MPRSATTFFRCFFPSTLGSSARIKFSKTFCFYCPDRNPRHLDVRYWSIKAPKYRKCTVRTRRKLYNRQRQTRTTPGAIVLVPTVVDVCITVTLNTEPLSRGRNLWPGSGARVPVNAHAVETVRTKYKGYSYVYEPCVWMIKKKK